MVEREFQLELIKEWRSPAGNHLTNKVKIWIAARSQIPQRTKLEVGHTKQAVAPK